MSSDEIKCPQCSGSRGLRRMLFDDPDNPVECANKFHDEPAPGPVLVRDEAAIEETPSEQLPPPERPPQPKWEPLLCAHCGAENSVQARMIMMGQDLRVLIVHCGGCRKIISAFQPLDLQVLQMPSGMPH